jgi:hypothetical protein
MSLYSRREDNTAKFLYSSEDRLDGKLCGDGGHFGIGWPRLEAIGSIQYLGQKLHVPGRDQKDIRVTQDPMDCLVNGILSIQRFIKIRVANLRAALPRPPGYGFDRLYCDVALTAQSDQYLPTGTTRAEPPGGWRSETKR